MEDELDKFYNCDGHGTINVKGLHEEYEREQQLRWARYKKASSEEREDIRIESCIGFEWRGSKYGEKARSCGARCECSHVSADHDLDSDDTNCLYCYICDESHESFDINSDDIPKGVTFSICNHCNCIIENIENNKCECECECEREDKNDITLHKLCNCEEFQETEYPDPTNEDMNKMLDQEMRLEG